MFGLKKVKKLNELKEKRKIGMNSRKLNGKEKIGKGGKTMKEVKPQLKFKRIENSHFCKHIRISFRKKKS